jgi:hypothetical protein
MMLPATISVAATTPTFFAPSLMSNSLVRHGFA